jgi:predicted transcriptional regulator
MKEEEYENRVIAAFKELTGPLSVTSVSRQAHISFRKSKQIIKSLEKKGKLVKASGRGTWWKIAKK